MAQWQMIEREQRDTLGEGTAWSAREQALYWVDILDPALNRLSLVDGKIERWAMPEPLGWVVERSQGGMIGGFRSGFAEIDLDPFAIRPIGDPESHLPGNRMNDGKADRHGAIWCGTMEIAEENAQGSLYRLDPNGEWAPMDTGYLVPNGPAFSACGRWLYHSDTGLRTIYRFALTEDGPGNWNLVDREVFARFDEADGYPDGMTVDAEGCLWVAHWDGGKVSRFDPQGKVERSIALPARRTTNIAFAGPNLDRMFVTSATVGLEPTVYDGALFEVDAGVKGLPTHTYAG
ncbi:SMP-30/gluconolactonase/LRE family protein [Novosphingobium sp. JCM 18896]|uniref:SMP-30/gluconolactonase/LRE family protein n=1 Tax=Novosphingobium sp. JCM 18896 TaxID=2989731 RepID=UPI002223BFF7|nr:SMP-30/gluconolactonase/LRE family protein [Novosphingobium sp. JCM 18896]MCW1428970.1 SMP-30/gluconolactonase/LRE family protein [Novosphingobium sp. JCM 18896]